MWAIGIASKPFCLSKCFKNIPLFVTKLKMNNNSESLLMQSETTLEMYAKSDWNYRQFTQRLSLWGINNMFVLFICLRINKGAKIDSFFLQCQKLGLLTTFAYDFFLCFLRNCIFITSVLPLAQRVIFKALNGDITCFTLRRPKKTAHERNRQEFPRWRVSTLANYLLIAG